MEVYTGELPCNRLQVQYCTVVKRICNHKNVKIAEKLQYFDFRGILGLLDTHTDFLGG